jgi:hypothetical protein
MEHLRLFGKYLTIASCAAAVIHGLIYQKLLGPLPLSILCVIGIVIWTGSFFTIKIRKYLASRSARREGALPRK